MKASGPVHFDPGGKRGTDFDLQLLPWAVAVVRAYRWQDQIVTGEIRTIGQLAQQTGMSETYINRILQCAYLSPKIVDAVLAGKHRLNLTLDEILRGIPLEWREQEALFLAPERIAGEPAPEV